MQGFEDKVARFKAQHPDMADKFQKQLDGMKALLALRERRYREADAEVDKFEQAVERANMYWQMSMGAARMNKLAGQQDPNVFEKIKTEVAFDSIEASMNRAFAELETSLLDAETSAPSKPALQHQPAEVIDIPVIVASKERAQ